MAKLSFFIFILFSVHIALATKFDYPKARRDEKAVDEYHGTKVPDPYRWLEDPDSEETKQFIVNQNSLTYPFFYSYPKREALRESLFKFSQYPMQQCPTKTGDGKSYFFKNTNCQSRRVLFVQDSLEAEPKVFFDPNKLSKDGTIALFSGKFSVDGSIYAYSLTANDSDWKTIHFMNTKTGEKYPETLKRVKWSEMSWTHDNRGIFYSHYPPGDGKADGSETSISKNHQLSYHKVGTPQDQDVVVADFPQDPLIMVDGRVTDCGKWLIVIASKELDSNLVYFTKLDAEEEITGKLPLTEIVGVPGARYDYVGTVGSKAIFKTNKNAPNDKLVSVDLEDFEENKFVDLIPEDSVNTLKSAHLVYEDKLVVCYLEDVKDVLKIFDAKTGKFIRQLPLEVGNVYGFYGEKRFSEICYEFQSFFSPGTIYKTDLKNIEETPEVFIKTELEGFDMNLYKVDQIFYSSKDGTKIPMYIISRKDIELNGTSLCLLYGYGGFNLNILPDYSAASLILLQHFNAVIAIPNIRGGGEYGEKWHDGGRLFNKQNVFDDFQSAAEYLINNGYTSPKKLIIHGISNGGLLVAACVNQRPDLFAAAIAEVGVMDMLKYHKFTIGYSWKSEYGTSDEPEHFENLLKYSPLHNVRPPADGTQYPAMLLLTADHDDRVVPLHSLKLIATLQHELGNLTQQTNPLLIRVDVNSGHGLMKHPASQFDEIVDKLSFVMQTLELDFTDN